MLSRVKDWVRQGIVPGRLELDFGDPNLKSYVKFMPVLRLKPVVPEQDEEDPGLNILVKTDVQGTSQSERYCLPEELIVTLINDLHLQHTHLGVETTALTLRHLVWFPALWARTWQVLLRCPGYVQKHNHQADKRIAGCYYPREKGNVAEYVHIDLAGPLPESVDGG